MIRLDDKNRRIIDILEKDSKTSINDISKMLKMPATTVHNRLKWLESSGMIKGYTVSLDYNRLGKGIGAFILVGVVPGQDKKISQQEICQKIALREEVESVAIITGNHDIILKVRVESIPKLNQFITHYLRNIDGIGKTETTIILEEIR